MIIVAEGAQDVAGNPVTANDIKEVHSVIYSIT